MKHRVTVGAILVIIVAVTGVALWRLRAAETVTPADTAAARTRPPGPRLTAEPASPTPSRTPLGAATPTGREPEGQHPAFDQPRADAIRQLDALKNTQRTRKPAAPSPRRSTPAPSDEEEAERRRKDIGAAIGEQYPIELSPEP